MKIFWDVAALEGLKNIYDYIKTSSPQNAENVRDNIIKSVSDLDKLIIHRPDKYKKNNDGTYRAYQIFSYRISYRITSSEIKILRLRHVKMKPEMY